jgi:hypothetical protein
MCVFPECASQFPCSPALRQSLKSDNTYCVEYYWGGMHMHFMDVCAALWLLWRLHSHYCALHLGGLLRPNNQQSWITWQSPLVALVCTIICQIQVSHMARLLFTCWVVELGRVDACKMHVLHGSDRCSTAATNSQWAFQTSVDVTLLLQCAFWGAFMQR